MANALIEAADAHCATLIEEWRSWLPKGYNGELEVESPENVDLSEEPLVLAIASGSAMYFGNDKSGLATDEQLREIVPVLADLRFKLGWYRGIEKVMKKIGEGELLAMDSREVEEVEELYEAGVVYVDPKISGILRDPMEKGKWQQDWSDWTCNYTTTAVMKERNGGREQRKRKDSAAGTEVEDESDDEG